MTEDDIKQIVELGAVFWDAVPYKAAYSPETTEALIRWMDENHYLHVMKKEDKIVAMIGVLMHPMMYNQDVFQGTEIFFYVSPEERKNGLGEALLQYTENDLKELGVETFVMSEMPSSSMDLSSFYTKIGYRLGERQWIKEL